MKVSAYLGVGDWTKSIDVEYQAELEPDCVQANIQISRVLQNPKNHTIKIALDAEEIRKNISDILDSLGVSLGE